MDNIFALRYRLECMSLLCADYAVDNSTRKRISPHDIPASKKEIACLVTEQIELLGCIAARCYVDLVVCIAPCA